MRDLILKELETLIFDTIKRCSANRYQSKTKPANPHKIRQGYINSLSNLVKVYNQLLKDKQVDELVAQLKELGFDIDD